MTPDQIRKIAEEYASQQAPLYGKSYYRLLAEANSVLSAISERYCVVERSKVEDLYELSSLREKEVDIGLKLFLQGAKKCMIQLFGSETFNEKDD